MKLIIMGPPGSGKGTVAERLAQDFKLKQISPGAILREEVKKNTSIGQQIKTTMERGNLVPNKFVVELVKLEIGKSKNFILDGFPRSLDQAKEINDIKIDLVIYLDVPDKVLIERFQGRRIDPQTGKGYHLKYIPPPKSILKRLIQRPDDKPKVIKERLKVYHKTTTPVIKYYQRKKILQKVDGVPLPKIVYQAVKKLIA